MPFAICTDLRAQFQEIARKYSPEPRHVYAFLTTAIVRPFISLSIYVSECDGAIFVVVVVWTGHRSYGRHAWDDPREDRQRQPPICGAHTLITLYLDPTFAFLLFCSPHPTILGSRRYGLLCHNTMQRRRISSYWTDKM
jgi:hypothetical protein